PTALQDLLTQILTGPHHTTHARQLKKEHDTLPTPNQILAELEALVRDGRSGVSAYPAPTPR
ncbi:hypothetical protein ACWC0C_48155, partial [Streptomyces sp. NPDC001709]